MVNWRVFEKLKLAVKQCYQTSQIFNRTKIGEKCQNLSATFWVIFKHYGKIAVATGKKVYRFSVLLYPCNFFDLLQKSYF